MKRSKEDYNLAKKVVKQTVFAAKKKAEKEKLNNIEKDTVTVFRIAKQMRKENKDIVGEKCIRNDSGKLAYSDDEKKIAWKQHYERLLNVEFLWSEEDISVADPVLGPPPLVTPEMVEKAIRKMKKGKANLVLSLMSGIGIFLEYKFSKYLSPQKYVISFTDYEIFKIKNWWTVGVHLNLNSNQNKHAQSHIPKIAYFIGTENITIFR